MPLLRLNHRFQQLKIKHKILSLVAVFTCLLLLTSGFTLYSLVRVVKNNDILSEHVLPAIQNIDTLNNTINHICIKHFKYLLSVDEEEKKEVLRAEIPEWEAKRERYTNSYGKIIHSAQERKDYSRYVSIYDRYNQMWLHIVQLDQQGHSKEAKALMSNQGRKLFLQAEAILVNISQKHLDQSVTAQKSEIEVSDTAVTVIIVIDLLASMLTVILGLYVAFQISRPVQRMTEFAEKITSHEEVNSVPLILSNDEIGVLNKAFLVMLESISTKNESLNVLNQKLEADLLERKRLERQLIHAQKMEAIGTLTGGIAHDFNNLLWMIMGNSEVLLELLQEDSNEHEIQKDILQAAERAKALVQQLLDFSRKGNSEIHNFSIRSLISEVCKQIQPRIPSHIRIQTDLIDSRLLVSGDPNKFHRVITNIMTNACHALENNPDAEIQVSLKEVLMATEDLIHFPEGAEPGTYQLLEIADNGCGMSKETIAKVFDPFFSTKTVGAGTGLGLSIAHSIITEMRGYITAYSDLGQGSIFKIFIPAANAEMSEREKIQIQIQRIETSAEGKTDQPKTILLVDDEALIRAMVQRMLEKLGHTVHLCENGEEGLEAIIANSKLYDLVITDQTMPVMTGVEMAQQIYTINKELPIIMESGNIQTIRKSDLENTGIREVVSKPVQYKDLKTSLEKIWNEHNA